MNKMFLNIPYFERVHPAWLEALKPLGKIEGNLLTVSRADYERIAADMPYAVTADQMRDHGPKLWAALHRRPSQYTPTNDAAWLADFERRLGCPECVNHWRSILADLPPDTVSPARYFAWTVHVHNRVNRQLAKRELALHEARELWHAEGLNSGLGLP